MSAESNLKVPDLERQKASLNNSQTCAYSCEALLRSDVLCCSVALAVGVERGRNVCPNPGFSEGIGANLGK